MEGRIPVEKLASYRCLTHEHILLYPVVLLEDLFKATDESGLLHEGRRGGKYVHTTCPRKESEERSLKKR